jgi:hypothetical protein
MVPPSIDARDYLVEVSDVGLTPDLSYHLLLDKYTKAVDMAQMGIISLMKESPLFQVTLAPAGPGRFALIISLSHTIADGDTFYTIHSMLGSNAEVKKLDRASCCTLAKDIAQRKMFGLDKLGAYWDTRKLSFQSLRGLIRPKPPPAMFRVSPTWLKQEKELAKLKTLGRGFVSANDILTSWFCNITECTSGWMCLNLRNRVDGLTSLNAGNYEVVVPYWPEEYDNSVKIRESLSSGRTARNDTPGYLDNATGRFSGITNWATFSKPVDLAGMHVITHIPVMNCINLNTWGMMIVFKAGGSEDLGVCIFARDQTLMEKISSSPALRPWGNATSKASELGAAAVLANELMCSKL